MRLAYGMGSGSRSYGGSCCRNVYVWDRNNLIDRNFGSLSPFY